MSLQVRFFFVYVLGAFSFYWWQIATDWTLITASILATMAAVSFTRVKE